MSATVPYIGSKISLVSNSDIRYEGILYTINTQESTIALQSVRCCGTEGRKVPEIPPSSEIYDFIIFRGQDIKDLTVLESANPALSAQLNDPAIMSVGKPPAGSGGKGGGKESSSGGGARDSGGYSTSKGSSAYGGGKSSSAGGGGYGSAKGSGGQSGGSGREWGGWGNSGGWDAEWEWPSWKSDGKGGSQGYRGGGGYSAWGNDSYGKGSSGKGGGGKDSGKGSGKSAPKGGKDKGGGKSAEKGGKDKGGKFSDKGSKGGKSFDRKGGGKGRSGGKDGAPVGELLPSVNEAEKTKYSEEFDIEAENKKFEKVDKAGEDEKTKPLSGYDKSSSFFDNISCEATERAGDAERPRIDREMARQNDKDTFGDTRRPPRPTGGRRGKGGGSKGNRY